MQQSSSPICVYAKQNMSRVRLDALQRDNLVTYVEFKNE